MKDGRHILNEEFKPRLMANLIGTSLLLSDGRLWVEFLITPFIHLSLTIPRGLCKPVWC
jgi:hypothetical protein